VSKVPTTKELNTLIENLDLRMKSVEDALKIRPTTLTLTERFRSWVKDNVGYSIIVVILAIYVPYYLIHKDQNFNDAVDTRVEGVLSRPDGVLKKLDDVEKSTTKIQSTLDVLTPYIQKLVMRDFDKNASLSKSELEQKLPLVKETIAVAQMQNIKISPNTIQELGTKLATMNSTAPDFWPTSLAFINFRSQVTEFNRGIVISTENMPNCRDTKPTKPTVLRINPATNQVQIANPAFSNCQITLDSPADAKLMNSLLTQVTARLSFNHCVVNYFGGPITVILEFHHDHRFVHTYDGGKETESTETYVDGPTLEFNDCLFNLNVGPAPPSASELKFAQDMLFQSGPTFVLPTPPHS
jgi:hypothetical protein